jgi:hypothetical protein
MRNIMATRGTFQFGLRSQVSSVGCVTALVILLPIACGGPPPEQVTVQVGALTTSPSGALMPFGGANATCVAAVGNQLQIAACGGQGQGLVISGTTIETTTSPPSCLAIQNGNLGAGVATLTACDATAVSQQWYFSGGQIISLETDTMGNSYCLDAANGNGAIGNPLDVWVCNHTSAQQFWPAGFTMKIASTFSSSGTPECLDVLYDNETVGASLDDSVCNDDSTAQWFVLTEAQQIALANNTSLCVSRGTAQNGLATVALASCNWADQAQKWFFFSDVSGGDPLVGIASMTGGCLDIWQRNPASGTPIDDWSCNGTPAQLWQPTPATSFSGNPWAKVVMPFPGSAPGPTNLALLTDGTVFASDSSINVTNHNEPQPVPGDTSTNWYVLQPDIFGSYANGTWKVAPPANVGRWGNSSFVLADGRYMQCGGEYVSDRYQLAIDDNPQGDKYARCEIYDPTSFSWTEIAPFPAFMRDTIAVELPNGRVMALEWSQVGNGTWIFDPSTNQWQPDAPFDRTDGINNEGDCILQQDGNAFCGIDLYSEYLPAPPPPPGQPYSNGTWINGVPVGSGPPAPPTPLNFPPGLDEQGPMLLLYDGRVLVLGGGNSRTFTANAPSAIFTPGNAGVGGSWTLATAMPANGSTVFTHGDSPAAVMPDGRVLVTSREISPTGAEVGDVLHEYDPSANTWKLVPSLPTSLQGENMRMLTLPSGQVLVTGTSDGSMWLYNPSGTPHPSWKPTITAIAGPVGGQYRLTGTQLNGLTNGANYGDDAKMTTSYPIVSLTDNSGSGHVYYARTSTSSSPTGATAMAPSPTSGACSFTLPPGIPAGSYTVHVSASGEQSDPTPSSVNKLVVSGIHVSAVTVNQSNPLFGTVFLSSAAPAGGQQVTLAIADPPGVPRALGMPASITVPAGQTSWTFSGSAYALGSNLVSAQTYPANSSFSPVTVRMGWTIRSLTGPSVLYGAGGASNSVPWTITFSAPIPTNTTVNSPSSPLNVTVTASAVNNVYNDYVNSPQLTIATIPSGGVVIQGSQLQFNVTKAAQARGLATVTASIGNSVRTFTFSERDTDFHECAALNGSCVTKPSEQRLLAFGANGYYSYALSSMTGTTACNLATFGGVDPNPGAAEYCYMSTYALAAIDGKPFSLSAPADVARGSDTGYSYNGAGRLNKGTYTCNSNVFSQIYQTDPTPGYGGPDGAGPYCFAGPDQNEYVYMGDQNSTFTVPPSTPMAYGGAGHFVFKIVSGTVTCNASTFPDPTFPNSTAYPFYTKSCYRLQYPNWVADENQSLVVPTGTPVFFGTGLNGNFLQMVTPPSGASCTTSAFGGDPDPTTGGKHCWACGALSPGQQLVQGQSLTSCDGHVELSMQTDGNLVIYRDGVAHWDTQTGTAFGNTPGYRVTMQTDGNLVLYDVNGNALFPTCAFTTAQLNAGPWNSTPGCLPSWTNGTPGASLAMQDDGNLVVYGPPGNQFLWASWTH